MKVRTKKFTLIVLSLFLAVVCAVAVVLLTGSKTVSASNSTGVWTAVPMAPKMEDRSGNVVNPEYDFNTGYTQIVGGGWGNGTYYTNAVSTNGLTVDFYSDDLSLDNGTQIGFFLSSTQHNFPASPSTMFTANLWNARGEFGSTQARVYYTKYHSLTIPADNIAYADYELTNSGFGQDGTAGYVFDADTKIGFSTTFVKHDANRYKLITTILYGDLHAGQKLVTFVNASYIPDTAYIGTYGDPNLKAYIRVSDANTRNSQVQISGDTVSNMIYHERFAYYNQKVALDKLTLKITLPSINTAYDHCGDIYGVAFAKTPAEFWADRPAAFNALVRPNYNLSQHNSLGFRLDHDYESTPIAFVDQALTNNKIGVDDQTNYIFDYQSTMAVELKFEKISATLWKLTTSSSAGGMWQGQTLTTYLSNDSFKDIVDENGYTYVVVYGEGDKSESAVSLKCEIQQYVAQDEFNINYVLGGGTNNPSNPAKYTVDKTVTFLDPTRDGYDFVEWQKDGVKITSTEGLTGDITITAIWQEKEYNISYVLGGGTNNPSNPAKYKVSNKVTFLDPTKTDYVFVEWQKDGVKITSTEGLTGDITITAIWRTPTPKTFNITYVLNGGTNNPSNPATFSTADPVVFQNPTRDGYDFVEWQKDGVKITSTAGCESDITVTAVWQQVVPPVPPTPDPTPSSGCSCQKKGGNNSVIAGGTFLLALALIPTAGIIIRRKRK